MLVRIVGSDPGRGVLIDGRTYFPGDEADLSTGWAAWMIRQGRAIPIEAPTERVAVPVVEHRDPVLRRRKK